MEDLALLKAKEASRILRLPLSTLYRLCKAKKIKAVKIGRQWRFKKEDILLYFDKDVDTSMARYKSDEKIGDRRQYPRINCHVNCGFKIIINHTKNIQSSGIIKNISAGGVLLEVPEENLANIKIEDPIDLNFNMELNDENMLIRSSGRIVRTNANNFGIKFRTLPYDTKSRIIDYVGK